MKGIVLDFNTDRGIGTILGNDGLRYFVSHRNIDSPYKILSRKEHVEFEVKKITVPGKNHQAINVMRIEPASLGTAVLKNPFNLGPINKPEYFAGRKHIISEGINALVNNNNLLLIGNRGMGKSSLANQLYYIAQGDTYLINKLRIDYGIIDPLQYAVISVRAFKESKMGDIAGNIVREFIKKYQLSMTQS